MGVEELAISIAEERLTTALQRARSLESSDRTASAVAYEEAAGYAERIARAMKGGYHRLQAQERAKGLRDKAASMRGPEPVPVATETPARQAGGASPPTKHPEIAASFAARADTRWDDIAGLDQTKRLLKGMVFAAVAQPPPGIKVDPPSGILLYGPPGTGKTMLAAAAAGQFGATFLNVPADRLKDKYVGESAKILQAVFDHAQRNAPALIFFDDIDTLVTNRESGETSGVSRDLIGGLLTAMDGFNNKGSGPRPLVLVIANTNQPWILDEALMSRFTQRVYVPLPDATTRKLVLSKLILERGYTCEVDLAEIAERTQDFSGRELANFQKAVVGEMIAETNREMVDRNLTVEQMRNAIMRVATIRRAHVEQVLGVMRPKTSEETIRRMEAWGRE